MAHKPKRNIFGDVYCGICDRYHRPDGFDFDKRTGRPRAYCRDCDREYAREYQRHRHRTNPKAREARQANAERQKERLRKQTQYAELSRRDIVQSAVTTIRARGLTLTEISTLVGVSMDTMRQWRNGAVPQPAIEARVVRLLVLTSGMTGQTRARGPYATIHPQFESLERVMSQTRAETPLRANWRRGRRRVETNGTALDYISSGSDKLERAA